MLRKVLEQLIVAAKIADSALHTALPLLEGLLENLDRFGSDSPACKCDADKQLLASLQRMQQEAVQSGSAR